MYSPWRNTINKRELKQQRRQRLRKRHLKIEVVLLTNFIAYFISFNSSNVCNFFWSSGKEKESRCLESMSSKKREIRNFRVVVVQKCTKKGVMHVQSYLNLLHFCRTRSVAVAVVFTGQCGQCWVRSRDLKSVESTEVVADAKGKFNNLFFMNLP